MRRLRLAMAIFLGVVSPALPAEPQSKIGIAGYILWASDTKPDDADKGKLPPELQKHEELIKRSSKKKFLTLEGKPTRSGLEMGKPVSVKLPDGTKVEWRLEKESDQLVVRQILTPPQKDAKPSEVVLKKLDKSEAPRINVISRGEEKSLLLIVQFSQKK